MNGIFELMSLFDKILQPRWSVYRHLLFWVGLYFWISFSPYDDVKDPWQHEMTVSLFWVFFAMVEAYFVSYRIFPRLFTGTAYLRVIVEFIIGSYIIAVINRIAVIYVLEPIVRSEAFSQEPLSEIVTDVQHLFSLYFLHTFSVSLVFIFLKMLKDQYLVHKRVLESEKEKAEAELNVLRNQLNPHFLFNTLNNIYSLSLVNSPNTSKAVAGLSGILDHLLYRCSGKYVPVSQEIDLLSNYLALERLRYHESLELRFDHSSEKNVQIAPLILLSLVENAFKHLAPGKHEAPVVQINLSIKDNLLEFVVSNTYIPQSKPVGMEGIGLQNIRKQLHLIYPGQHSFSTSEKSGVFIAYLSIKLANHQ